MPKTLIENIELFPGICTSLITLDNHEDNSGEFLQVWKDELGGHHTEQINVSVSKKGAIRGLHFQKFFRQRKIVTVLDGLIVDIVVCINPNDKNFGKFNFIYLERGQQLLVPDNMAHGFMALTDSIIMYQVNVARMQEYEREIYIEDLDIEHANDKSLNLRDFMDEQMFDSGLDIMSTMMLEKDIISKYIFNAFDLGYFDDYQVQ